MLCTIIIEKEDDTYIAKDARTGIADEGVTMEEAMSNLKEALELYYKDSDDSRRQETPLFTTYLEVSV